MAEEQEFRRYFVVLLQWWWLVLVCAIIGGVAAFVISSQLPPIYSSSATLLVNQAPTSSMNDYTALIASERLARTYSQMLSGRPVLEAVITKLDLQEDSDKLASRVDVSLVRDTQLIRLSVEDESSQLAADIANAIVEAFTQQNSSLHQSRYAESLVSIEEQIAELSTQMDETQAAIDVLVSAETSPDQSALHAAEKTRLETIMAGYRNTYASLLQSYERMRLDAVQSSDNVLVFEPAQVPEKPIRPNPLQNTLLAVMASSVLAVGAAFLIEYLDDTLKSPENVLHSLNLGTIGTIGQMDSGEEWVTVLEPRSPLAEAYRTLRTNIRFSSIDKPLRTILVTSSSASEGKSTTVANLAAVMAQSGLKVVAIDADLRRPRLNKLFDIEVEKGLTESLVEGHVDGNLMTVGPVAGLKGLFSGAIPPNPAELLGSQRMKDLLAELLQEADIVLIDSPPILPVTDAAVLAQIVDGVLVVIDAGGTREGAARRAVDGLRQVGANLIGAVLASVPAAKGGYYNYYYYHYDYYDDEANGQSKSSRKRNGIFGRRKQRNGNGNGHKKALLQGLFRRKGS